MLSKFVAIFSVSDKCIDELYLLDTLKYAKICVLNVHNLDKGNILLQNDISE